MIQLYLSALGKKCSVSCSGCLLLSVQLTAWENSSPNGLIPIVVKCLRVVTVDMLQAKTEYDHLVAAVGQSRPVCPAVIRVTSFNSKPSVLRRPDFHQLLARHGGDISCLSQELNTSDYDSFALAVPGDRIIKPQLYTLVSLCMYCIFTCFLSNDKP